MRFDVVRHGTRSHCSLGQTLGQESSSTSGQQRGKPVFTGTSLTQSSVDGRKLTGVKRRLDQLAAQEPMRAAVRSADTQRIERLVEAEGYFRALADGLRI